MAILAPSLDCLPAPVATSMVTRPARSLARGAVVALALAVTFSPLAAAPSDPPKKVGTERIVVDPKPSVGPGAPAAPAQAGPTSPAADGAIAEMHKGEEGLPPAVAKMRRRLLDAAYSGDLQKIKIVMQSNEMPPVLSIHEIGDPVEFLKSQSGDGQGFELLAILTDVLESGWTRIKPGTPQEMYVWPAFVAMAPDKLTPDQLVEVYKIVTSSDFEEMKVIGKYTFYTVGIGPDGTWHWFKLAD
ncbi:hypothetical protein [Pinisolibacter sp.]|uniref:hypothetical protein n=1 Tax=Pinisolibacter sp. TaxID=2172024 RepID=UPI002FDC998B